MTNRERVIASLNHRQPDRVPYAIGFTQPAHAKMAQYYGDPVFAAKLGNAFCSLSASLRTDWQEVRPGHWRDEFGVVWNRTVDKDIGVIEGTVVTEDTVDSAPLPDPNDPRRFEGFPKLIAANKDQFIMASLGFSLFERAWTMAGMENLLLWMVEKPQVADRLLDRITEYNLAIVRNAVKHDIDCMHFGDDWGQQRGLIMGPKHWRRFIKPRIKEMYGAAKKAGKFVSIHSCGDVDELLPDLIECGLDMFNPFQPEVMDVFEVKRQFGDRLTFWGGISTQRTLPYGTPDDVRREVRTMLARIGENGGYVCAPAHGIPGDAPAENIAAMIEVLRTQ